MLSKPLLRWRRRHSKIEILKASKSMTHGGVEKEASFRVKDSALSSAAELSGSEDTSRFERNTIQSARCQSEMHSAFVPAHDRYGTELQEGVPAPRDTCKCFIESEREAIGLELFKLLSPSLSCGKHTLVKENAKSPFVLEVLCHRCSAVSTSLLIKFTGTHCRPDFQAIIIVLS